MGGRKWRTVREQLPLLPTEKPVVQKIPPEGHSLAMQAPLLEEGRLSLGTPAQPFGWALCDFCFAAKCKQGASPVLILGASLCITLWGQSSTALSTAVFAGLFSAVNYNIVTEVRCCLFLVRMEPTGSIITCLPSRDELSESFPSPKCALLTCHKAHVLTCNLRAEEAGVMLFHVFSHPGKDISCELERGVQLLGTLEKTPQVMEA